MPKQNKKCPKEFAALILVVQIVFCVGPNAKKAHYIKKGLAHSRGQPMQNPTAKLIFSMTNLMGDRQQFWKGTGDERR